MLTSKQGMLTYCILLSMGHFVDSQSITVDAGGTPHQQGKGSEAERPDVLIITTSEALKSVMETDTASMIMFTDGEDDGSLQFLMLLAGRVWNSSHINWAAVDVKVLQTLAPDNLLREPGLWLFTSTHPRATGLRLPMHFTSAHGIEEAKHALQYATDVLRRSGCEEVCDEAVGLPAGSCWWSRSDGSHADPRKVIAKKKAEAAAKLKAMEAEINKLKAEL